MRLVIFVLYVLLIAPITVQAKIEKWVDESGKTHYGQRAPEGRDSKQVAAPVFKGSLVLKQERVVLYSTSWCEYCKKARAYLRAKRIPFTEYDIEKDTWAKTQYDIAEGQGVPFIVQGGKTQPGFTLASYNSFFEL